MRFLFSITPKHSGGLFHAGPALAFNSTLQLAECFCAKPLLKGQSLRHAGYTLALTRTSAWATASCVLSITGLFCLLLHNLLQQPQSTLLASSHDRRSLSQATVAYPTAASASPPLRVGGQLKRTQNTTLAMAALRPVTKVVQGQRAMEGAGVQICRTIGTPALRNHDPFLMLDELRLPAEEATAGFPDHPHRGFATFSIMHRGKMEHYDSVGNHGVIGPGGVQYMFAGRGVIHSEMPKVTTGDLWGYQLWINVPAKHKMEKPRYQDVQDGDIPAIEEDGVKVRVLAGTSYGATAPVEPVYPVQVLDVQLARGATFRQEVPAEWSALAYICDGEGKVDGTKAKHEQMVVLGAGDLVEATTESEGGMRFLFLAGKPIGESIVQHGPFVMNTQAEIMQAFRDYQSGQLQNPKDDVWAAA